jgi:hypothetical protein
MGLCRSPEEGSCRRLRATSGYLAPTLLGMDCTPVARVTGSGKDLGRCPRCATEGRSGRLRLVTGTSKRTGRPYELAACDADSSEARPCGYTAPTTAGELGKKLPCPECRAPMRPVRRRDGGHSWACRRHGWFLASRLWMLVTAPVCPKCQLPMVHRNRTDTEGAYTWACFEHGVFIESDAFGRGKAAPPRGSLLRRREGPGCQTRPP